ncbi:MAG: M23 family metallopeptidase, partial [Gammaproteobacteria bacterium]
LYAHASKVLVRPGDIVQEGQAIAILGSTGRSTGPHVHYEVRRNGTPVNPARYVARAAPSTSGG